MRLYDIPDTLLLLLWQTDFSLSESIDPTAPFGNKGGIADDSLFESSSSILVHLATNGSTLLFDLSSRKRCSSCFHSSLHSLIPVSNSIVAFVFDSRIFGKSGIEHSSFMHPITLLPFQID